MLRLESECCVKVGRTLGTWNERDIAGLRDFFGACFVAEHSELGWRWANKCDACRFASFGEMALLTEEAVPRVERCCSRLNRCLNDRLGVEIRGGANARQED